MSIRRYLLSFPERVVRSALGLSAGVAREVGEVVLPDAVRETHLYQHLVETTLRLLIEQVGGAEGVYPAAEPLPDGFLVRRTAGNVVEALGIVAFRASPVWVLAALADLAGMGRHLIPQIAEALAKKGLLDGDGEFTSVDQLLDGLERTSSRLAGTVNTPPLDVASLRAEWQALRHDARGLPGASLPSGETIGALWAQLTKEATRQDRSIFETSSAMAVSALQAMPEGARWFAHSARVGATRTGAIVGTLLLEHYRDTLAEIRHAGYATYVSRQVAPYVRAAASQFSPERQTLTERALDAIESRLGRRHPPE